ncbi:MAG: ATP-binding protein, partial [Actinobacteria bacterium]|nr:ATP-binding protein [Actinomycetota bacterium]
RPASRSASGPPGAGRRCRRWRWARSWSVCCCSAWPTTSACSWYPTASSTPRSTSNAIRHADAGTTIRVSGDVWSPGVLQLRVDDDGPGIDAPYRDRVFGAFEHGEIEPHSPGAGVGLFLVARFAELHGGRAWVTETENGRGASFRVEPPLAQPAVSG